MNFEPIFEVETKIVQKEGFLPDEVVTIKNVRMPLQEMGYFNSLQNIRSRYTKSRKPSYRDFSTEGGEI